MISSFLIELENIYKSETISSFLIELENIFFFSIKELEKLTESFQVFLSNLRISFFISLKLNDFKFSYRT